MFRIKKTGQIRPFKKNNPSEEDMFSLKRVNSDRINVTFYLAECLGTFDRKSGTQVQLLPGNINLC